MIEQQRVYRIKDLDSLLGFLREDLCWDLPEASIDDVSFEWTGLDLNLSEDVNEKLKDGLIRQLQPFATDQPWGIFVVEFVTREVSIITLRQILRCFVAKRRSARPDLPAWQCENLLFICVYGENGFTFAHFKGDNPYSSKLTTFSWHPGEPIRTVCEFNLPALVYDYTWTPETWVEEWQKAFDVEKVNKDFYRQIARFFYRLTGKEGHPRELVLPYVGDDLGSINIYEEFAIRLIGRSIFCWFLKHKVSEESNVPLIPPEALSLAAARETEDFYHSMLEPLFFEVMNKPFKDRKSLLVPRSEIIPFLNGGLFEPHSNDFYPGVANYGLKISSAWFIDFFSLLERYNFTITENSSIDVDVAVDPEMLGRIFENLLAELVPETGETARKATGSYYTPRAIVNYMVQESLKQYLLTNTTLAEEKVSRLLGYGGDVEDFSTEEKLATVTALRDIKVIDPACGSGAFPMGVLHRMLAMLEKVDPRLELWRAQYLKSLDGIVRQTVEKNISRENWAYIRKLMIIRDSIYGVDIQPVAVEIAKLRCFLSLVVDEIIIDYEENRGVEPLPNLEFKFVAANTLVGLPSGVSQSAFGVTATVNKLKGLREDYLRSFGAEKSQIEEEFRATQQKLFAENVQWAVADTLVKRLTEWDPFSYESCSWFDPEWMFGVKGGFDTVIGNPPYLEARHPTFSEQRKQECRTGINQRWGSLASGITRGSDLLVYFIETSVHMLAEKGTGVLLTQNAWLDTLYGKALQEFLMKTTNVIAIVDSDFKYFDSKVGPNINTIICVFHGRSPQPSRTLKFLRFHESFDALPVSHDFEILKGLGKVDYSQYRYSDSLLHDAKWGILSGIEDCLLQVLKVLQRNGSQIERIPRRTITIGQGLNLSSAHIVHAETASDYPYLESALIPFMTEGAPYVLDHVGSFLVDGSKLNTREKAALRAAGILPFDVKSTTKERPALIMPRGVSRHFCALNQVHAFSSSFVDIYDINREELLNSDVILNLWLILNSSLAWLLREAGGRKNLGGGLLKAEAADLKQFPIYFDVGNLRAIQAICDRVAGREVLETPEELDTPEHNAIDDLVFRKLNITEKLRHEIVDCLKRRISVRSSKSTT